MNRGVFLDRDGVLNEAHVVDGVPRPAASIGDLRILPDARAGCERLREAGFLLICVTNQPDIARGTLGRAAVDEINAALAAELGLDDVVVCPHDDPDGCECRKPKPGMTFEAAERFGIDLPSSFTVGDRWRDVEAGHRAATRTVFVDRHYDEPLTIVPEAVAAGLEEASRWIVEQARA